MFLNNMKGSCLGIASKCVLGACMQLYVARCKGADCRIPARPISPTSACALASFTPSKLISRLYLAPCTLHPAPSTPLFGYLLGSLLPTPLPFPSRPILFSLPPNPSIGVGTEQGATEVQLRCTFLYSARSVLQPCQCLTNRTSGFTYEVNLSSLTQTNTSSRKSRPIRRQT